MGTTALQEYARLYVTSTAHSARWSARLADEDAFAACIARAARHGDDLADVKAFLRTVREAYLAMGRWAR